MRFGNRICTTPRRLGINPRALGLAPRDLDGKEPAAIAEQFRKAAYVLLAAADEMDGRGGKQQ